MPIVEDSTLHRPALYDDTQFTGVVVNGGENRNFVSRPYSSGDLGYNSILREKLVERVGGIYKPLKNTWPVSVPLAARPFEGFSVGCGVPSGYTVLEVPEVRSSH